MSLLKTTSISYNQINASNFIMEPTSIIIGLVIGGIAAYIIASLTIKKGSSKAVEEANKQADLVIKEARMSAKRLEEEASVKADKIV